MAQRVRLAHRWHLPQLGWAVLACVVAVAPARGDDENPPEDPGASLYQALCAECHGADAKGDGPRAAVLEPRPADLTRLADRDEDLLRLEVLMRVIDGRRTVRAHGDSRMPIWGDRLAGGAPNATTGEPAKIMMEQSLAEYLLSLQPKPPRSEP
jgi:mono/diheme cytochrome c family protein